MHLATLYRPNDRSVVTQLVRGSVLILTSVILVACQSPHEPSLVSGLAAPSFDANTVDGRSFSYPGDFAEKPTIVLVWSTWCPYCKAVMPRLSEISADYRQHGLEIIAINAKERGHGDPAVYVEEAGYDFWTVADGDELADRFDVKYLPGLFVVSGDGEIAYRRGWTELPAGQTVADFWETELRATLEVLVNSNTTANRGEAGQ